MSALRECPKLTRITHKGEINSTLDQLMKKDWVISAIPCLNHTENVIAYQARYTHRIAINDQRITDIENNQVSFEYKDYLDDQSKTLATLVPKTQKQNNDLVPEYPCPKCRKGHLVPIRELSPV